MALDRHVTLIHLDPPRAIARTWAGTTLGESAYNDAFRRGTDTSSKRKGEATMVRGYSAWSPWTSKDEPIAHAKSPSSDEPTERYKFRLASGKRCPVYAAYLQLLNQTEFTRPPRTVEAPM